MSGSKHNDKTIEIGESLKRKGLSVTDSRKKIMQLFVQQKGALSHSDIEKKAGTAFDRVTIYRTLQTFLDKGIIHAIPSADASVRYALCNDACISSGHHHDNHVHFLCDACGKTLCLDEVMIPTVKLPAGYAMKEINMVVS